MYVVKSIPFKLIFKLSMSIQTTRTRLSRLYIIYLSVFYLNNNSRRRGLELENFLLKTISYCLNVLLLYFTKKE